MPPAKSSGVEQRKIGVAFPHEMAASLDVLKADKGLSTSAFVRDAIDRHLDTLDVDEDVIEWVESVTKGKGTSVGVYPEQLERVKKWARQNRMNDYHAVILVVQAELKRLKLDGITVPEHELLRPVRFHVDEQTYTRAMKMAMEDHLERRSNKFDPNLVLQKAVKMGVDQLWRKRSKGDT